MKEVKSRKSFFECFSDFLGAPENFTSEELLAELKEEGIDFTQLEKRVAEIVKKGSAERRLAWQSRAKERREEILKILESKQPAKVNHDSISKIKEILGGDYGQGALSYAEAYFRKKESFSEKDFESLVEDMEDLNLLEKINKKDK